jgi:hypothetical protein
MTRAIDGWASRQSDKPSRSEAIRRLVELGLSASPAARLPSPKNRGKAAHLAAEAIDWHTDRSASSEEQASRKQRLLKGPPEFRELRRDQQTTKRPGPDKAPR